MPRGDRLDPPALDSRGVAGDQCEESRSVSPSGRGVVGTVSGQGDWEALRVTPEGSRSYMNSERREPG